MRVDARDPAAFERVAGVPLVLRHARLLRRAGETRARFFVAGERERAAAAGALARAPAGLTVEVIAGAPDGPALDGATVYAGGLEPVGDARTPGGRKHAERRLYQLLRKSVDLDGVVAYYAMRPLSRLLTRLLLPTPITPNQVTLSALVCGVVGAACAAGGQFAAAGILFWVGAAVDCVDGDLARLRVQGSRLGEWLDTLADDVSTLGLLLGLGIGLTAEGYGQPWQVLGILGALCGLATEARIYLDLHRLGLPIDTAQYPWFFGAPRGRRGPLGRAFYACSFLFRRDAFVTVVAILLLGGARRVPFLVLFGGALVFSGMLIVHMWVTRRRQTGDILATNK